MKYIISTDVAKPDLKQNNIVICKIHSNKTMEVLKEKSKIIDLEMCKEDIQSRLEQFLEK